MNKQEILDNLEAARQIIRFDYPFEYKTPYGQWRNPRLGVDALRYVAYGYDVRMKTLPDKWADLKKAHAEGKPIQWKLTSEDNHLWRDTIMPVWKEGTDYRIKPEPIRIPLGPEDVPPGSIISVQPSVQYGWFTINATQTQGLHICNTACRFIYWEQLKQEQWKINRSLSSGKWDPTAWEPCYKEVTKE